MLPTLLWALSAAAGASPPAAAPAVEPPLDFRCDALDASTSPNRHVCRGHVVVRRGDLLLCCDQLEAHFADDWRCEHLICRGDVRARRNDEQVWGERAELSWATCQLQLTGRPHLRRGANVLRGARIDVDLRGRAARVRAPSGTLAPEGMPDLGRAGGAAPRATSPSSSSSSASSSASASASAAAGPAGSPRAPGVDAGDAPPAWDLDAFGAPGSALPATCPLPPAPR